MLVVTAIAHDDLLAALTELQRAGRKVVLFTLAEQPPERDLPGIMVYHLPHLVEDLIAPELVQAAEVSPHSLDRAAVVAGRSFADAPR